MIELDRDRLVFRFPEVHRAASLSISFQRTLRIPDDGGQYPLPPGLGQFPLHHVDDYRATTPAAWAVHGGVFFPMHQAEATWINFSGNYPMAVKVAAGKINAVTGRQWRNGLHKAQDYLVTPEQPWLDGFCVEKGLIRQFVAMPLGEGYTAEEQLTGAARHGGIQIAAYPMKRAVYDTMLRGRERVSPMHDVTAMYAYAPAAPLASEMGLAPGGLMRQEVYDDEHGIDAWDTEAGSRCFVHILNSAQFMQVTGHAPPHEPPAAAAYTNAGLPWFEYYDGDRKAMEGSATLAELTSVATMRRRRRKAPLPGNESVAPALIRRVGARSSVREGAF